MNINLPPPTQDRLFTSEGYEHHTYRLSKKISSWLAEFANINEIRAIHNLGNYKFVF